VPAEENARAQQALQERDAEGVGQYPANWKPPTDTRELARAIVTYKIGTVAMKGRIDLTLDCSETDYPGQEQVEGRPPRMVMGPPSTVNGCMAKIRYYRAPENQFAGVMRLWDVPGYGDAKMEAPWKQAYTQVIAEQMQKTIAQMNSIAQHFMQVQQQQFEHDQAVRQVMHNQFMQNMNEQGERNTENFENHEYQRDTETSDFVDYAMDRQTVMNTNTGQTYKITNQVTVGGDLQQVHGNGSPW
jgi:hypothetical protein